MVDWLLRVLFRAPRLVLRFRVDDHLPEQTVGLPRLYQDWLKVREGEPVIVDGIKLRVATTPVCGVTPSVWDQLNREVAFVRRSFAPWRWFR